MTTDHISNWALRYGMECRTVDGNDVEAVHGAAIEAVARIRETGKPFMLETYTYRLRGHFEPDDQSYVDPQELANWREKDPIKRLKSSLMERGTLAPADFAQMEQRINDTLDAALSFANASPFPELAELTTDVYA
jgi:pyruvate dehydrogenase E1 component alpha subunit